jgi:hypothetical protein
VPIDPATRVDPAAMPRDIGSRALDSLGLTAEQLATPRALTYSAPHLEDASGALGVFYASVVKHRDRWVFWSEDLPKETVRASPEVQLTFETARNTRYLVAFALDSAAQEFAVAIGETRTTLTPERGHVALIVSGAGNHRPAHAGARILVVREVPKGRYQRQRPWATLFATERLQSFPNSQRRACSCALACGFSRRC